MEKNVKNYKVGKTNSFNKFYSCNKFCSGSGTLCAPE